MNSEIVVDDIQALQRAVKGQSRLLPRCGGSKSALSTPTNGAQILNLNNITGIIAYDPAEYTITAYAGTPLLEIKQILSENRQYLPFDPPLVDRGASLGGSTAAGLNGAGSYRFGGIRDFLLAVQYIDGTGSLVKGGARVVKNSAGFDTPKLFIGSLGRFGILVELTYKVFPMPEQFATVDLECLTLDDALRIQNKFFNNPLEVEALHLSVEKKCVHLSTRIGGKASTIEKRTTRLRQYMDGGELNYGDKEHEYWGSEGNFNWLPEHWALVKIPLIPSKIGMIEKEISTHEKLSTATRRYTNGGQLCWIGIPDDPEMVFFLSTSLNKLRLSGLKIIGTADSVNLGYNEQNQFASRVKNALDPDSHFLEV